MFGVILLGLLMLFSLQCVVCIVLPLFAQHALQGKKRLLRTVRQNSEFLPNIVAVEDG